MPPGRVVADIGTDHALLPIHLVGSGRAPRAIATDVSPASLAKARAAVAAAGLSERIALRRGFGLSTLRPGEAAVLVLAGLGGLSIAQILAEGYAAARAAEQLLLQPMRHAEELRRRLAAGGFRLANEVLARERQRFYVIMAAEPGPMPAYPEALLAVGPLLVARPDPLLKPYLEMRIARERRIYARIEKAACSAAGRARARLALERVRAWEELLDAGGSSPCGGHR